MFCVFYFIKISKFALPGVMLIFERTSKDRKKDVMPKCNKINMRKKCHCLSSVKRYPEHVSAAGLITFELNPVNERCVKPALICLVA